MSVLIKWNKDWSDEFSLTGFTVLSEKLWKGFQRALELISYPQEMYFGTNEFYDFCDKEEIMRGITTVENLSNQDIKKLENIFSKSYNNRIEFGWTPVNRVFDLLSEENEEEYDLLFDE